MSKLQQLRLGIARAWDSVAEGRREFRELAGDALTRLQPEARYRGWRSDRHDAQVMVEEYTTAHHCGDAAGGLANSGDRVNGKSQSVRADHAGTNGHTGS